MAIQFMQMPTIGGNVSTLLDFAPLVQGLQNYQRGSELAQRQRDLTKIGDTYANEGAGAAGTQALRMGDLDAGMAFNKQAQADKDRQLKILGAGAQAVLYEQDPVRGQAIWNRVIKAAGVNANEADPEELDYRTGPKMFLAASGMAQDPRESRLLDLKIKAAELDNANAGRGKAPDLQEVYTETGGKQKGYFQNGQFVPVGGVASPRSDMLTAGDRKAILEADDKTQANASAISTLEKALELSKTADAGMAADYRSWLGTNLPDMLVPDRISSPESGQAAAELNNAIASNALDQLKATFGGMPTEGERKILLELQGSINQPRKVREAIYTRALQMARDRLEINRQEAEKLRGGNYFKPGGAAALPAPGNNSGATGASGGWGYGGVVK